jgi:glycine hydroxymethyltransferase
MSSITTPVANTTASANTETTINSTTPVKTMRIGVGADHGAVVLKSAIVEHLKSKGLQVDDLGTNSGESVDYPDFADVVCRGILGGNYDAGVLLCTTGVGMSIAANRYPGIQASLVCDPAVAALTREHNDANVLCLSNRTLSADMAKEILQAWLDTEPGDEGLEGARLLDEVDARHRRSAP